MRGLLTIARALVRSLSWAFMEQPTGTPLGPPALLARNRELVLQVSILLHRWADETGCIFRQLVVEEDGLAYSVNLRYDPSEEVEEERRATADAPDLGLAGRPNV